MNWWLQCRYHRWLQGQVPWFFHLDFDLLFWIYWKNTHWFSFNFSWSHPSFRSIEDLIWLLMLDLRYQEFPKFILCYISQDNLSSYLLKSLLFTFCWLDTSFRRSGFWLLSSFLLYLFPLLDFEIFWSVWRYVIFLRRKLFLQNLSIKLEKHG